MFSNPDVNEMNQLRPVEDILASLNRAPDAVSTKRYLLELAEAIIFSLNANNDLGPWETYQLSKAIGFMRQNIENSAAQSSTSWLSAAEASIVKSLVEPAVHREDLNGSVESLKQLSYEQLTEEVHRLRALLSSSA